MNWKRLSDSEIKHRVFQALQENRDYRKECVLGLPASNLDEGEFYDDAPFLEQAAFLSALVANPNHIGCHTLTANEGEGAFHGTQKLETEVIRLCAEEIFHGEAEMQDGYIASGGTEANIEALWIYRNYFRNVFQAKQGEIALLYSADSHYSFAKGIDLLGLGAAVIEVDERTRKINADQFLYALREAQSKGFRYFIVVANMGTTMFGSVDDLNLITTILEREEINFKLHVDAAFGGFIYPFTSGDSRFSFRNKHVNSITLDAHKLLQAPYGTGIFLIRKGWMHYVKTEEASYVPGKDFTLCGSRSGANALAVWMILMSYGSEGWRAKMNILAAKTESVCDRLYAAGIHYFNNPHINIISIPASEISRKVATDYYLVPDTHNDSPSWWKIVIMPHVKNGMIDRFMTDLVEHKLTTLK
jgi:tyrosine decarboxylase/aspartate 1-decarboxylase